MRLTRRLFFIPFLLPSVICGQISDDGFREQCMAHERPWNEFIRKLYGCPSPSGETTPDTCRVERAEIDSTNFRKAGEAAKKLWHLTEE